MINLIFIIAVAALISSLLIFKFHPNIIESLINKNTNKEPIKAIETTKRMFNAKSKCFDCERQINRFNNTQYNLIHPTKCFDCEKQINKKYNGGNSNLGHSSKCFSCETNL